MTDEQNKPEQNDATRKHQPAQQPDRATSGNAGKTVAWRPNTPPAEEGDTQPNPAVQLPGAGDKTVVWRPGTGSTAPQTQSAPTPAPPPSSANQPTIATTPPQDLGATRVQQPANRPPNAPVVPPVNAPLNPQQQAQVPSSPLPQRVPQSDPNPTQVQPKSAYGASRVQPPTQRPPTPPQHQPVQPSVQQPLQPPSYQVPPRPQAGRGPTSNVPSKTTGNLRRPAAVPQRQTAPQRRDKPVAAPQKQQRQRRRRLGWFPRLLIWLSGLTLILAFVGASFLIFQYYRIASDLPDVGILQSQAKQFESTFIYDGDGSVLYEISDPAEGRRSYVTLDQVSPHVIAATIATEDKDFWSNLGFDPYGIARAVYQNYTQGGVVSGASTITQQLARLLLLSPEERLQRTNERKIREIILSYQMRATYDPDEILELYLNEIYYGNLAYGIEAASKTYFGKSAAELNFAEASFLAGLPQSPAVYNIFSDATADLTLSRHQAVVGLTRRQAQGCEDNPANGIQVNGDGDILCITEEEAIEAVLEIKDREFKPPAISAQHPHWVNYIRFQLESDYGAQDIYRSGFRVFTTLDSDLQKFSQKSVRDHVSSLASRSVSNGAVVVIDPLTGRILSMVGSDNFNDPEDGQINMALQPRQPGSSIKPFVFLKTFENGWTPSTVVWDVPTNFPNGALPDYVPRNYDEKFRGPVTVRNALGNSLNIPAVRALQEAGIYDNPNTAVPGDGVVDLLTNLGVTTLDSNQYGLALSLGGGDVNLVEWTAAYATIANEGRRVFPYSISRITNAKREIICEQPQTPDDWAIMRDDPNAIPPCETPPDNWGQQVIPVEHAYLMSDILSDDQARYSVFGAGTSLETQSNAAVKTGTTNDVRDTWAMGYLPNLAVGVWTGNADFTPMDQELGSATIAGPIWNRIITGAFDILDDEPAQFARPSTIVEREVCVVTGAAVSDYCREMINPYTGWTGTYTEIFAAGTEPTSPEDDIIGYVDVDQFSGKLPSTTCGRDYVETRRVLNLQDPFVLDWLAQDGLGQQFAQVLKIEEGTDVAPIEECDLEDPRPLIEVAYPPNGQIIKERIEVWGFIDVLNGEFDYYEIEWGFTEDPTEWGPTQGRQRIPVTRDGGEPQMLGQWSIVEIPSSIVTIRVRVFDTEGHTAEVRRTIQIDNPNPIAPTPTPTTVVPTETPITPAETAAPDATPTPLPPTPTATVIPTETPAAP